MKDAIVTEVLLFGYMFAVGATVAAIKYGVVAAFQFFAS